MTIYLVMRDDGNVCCPAAEVDSVWSERGRAESRVSILKSSGTHAHVDERTVDAEVVGL